MVDERLGNFKMHLLVPDLGHIADVTRQHTPTQTLETPRRGGGNNGSHLSQARLHEPRPSSAHELLFLIGPSTACPPAVKSPPQCALCEVAKGLVDLGLLL